MIFRKAIALNHISAFYYILLQMIHLETTAFLSLKIEQLTSTVRDSLHRTKVNVFSYKKKGSFR